MKIRVKASLAGKDTDGNTFTYGKGAEVDAPSQIAEDLIKAGLAEAIDKKPKKSRKRKTTKKGAETASLDVDKREIEE